MGQRGRGAGGTSFIVGRGESSACERRGHRSRQAGGERRLKKIIGGREREEKKALYLWPRISEIRKKRKREGKVRVKVTHDVSKRKGGEKRQTPFWKKWGNQVEGLVGRRREVCGE